MRKFFLLAICGLLAAALVFGGARRVTKGSGTVVDTIVDQDYDTIQFDKVQLTRNATTGDLNYDGVLFGFYVPNMTQINTVGGEGLVDSVITRIYAGTDSNIDTLVHDTQTLPATFEFFYDTPDDSGIGALYHDHIWWECQVMDSAGTGTTDSLQYQITWWYKLFEDRSQ